MSGKIKGPLYDPGLCRCCGTLKKCRLLNVEYQFMGQKEIYCDMLVDCFGLLLCHLEEAPEDRLICTTCVGRLREASSFRKQVIQCEDTFVKVKLHHSVKEVNTTSDEFGLDTKKEEENVKLEPLEYDNAARSPLVDDHLEDAGCSEDDPLLENILIKSETAGFAKEERINKTVNKWPTLNKFNSMVTKKLMVSSSNFKDRAGMPASSSLKSPKTGKNFVKNNIVFPSNKLKDITGMPTASGLKPLKIGNKTVYVKLHSAKPSLMKQETSKYHKKVSRSNKSNFSDANKKLLGLEIPFRNDLTVKKVLTDRSVKATQQTMSKKKISTSQVHNDAVPETTRIKENSAQILLYTTAYPFRFPMPCVSVACVYCTKENIEPASYRAHIDTEHPKTINPRKAYRHIASSNILLKVECSDLKCRICNKSFNTLETIAKHLSEDHRKEIDFTTSLGVAPFKFTKNKLFTCAFCGKQFVHLMTLSKHTNTHYSRFMCDICGKEFSCISNLRQHLKFGHVGKPICKRCESTFETREELNLHLENSAKCRPYVCNECGERLAKYYQKRDHMIAVHGIKPRSYKCFTCPKEFSSKGGYSLHLVNNHATDIGTKCDICDKKFLHQHEVSQHMSAHTGGTPYQCEQCEKAYTTKKSLTKHVRINHKCRYSCDECKKHFGGKSSLLTHIATHH